MLGGMKEEAERVRERESRQALEQNQREREAREADLAVSRLKKQEELRQVAQEKQVYLSELKRTLKEKAELEAQRKFEEQQVYKSELESQIHKKQQSAKRASASRKLPGSSNGLATFVPLEQTSVYAQKVRQVRALEKTMLKQQFNDVRQTKADHQLATAQEEKTYTASVAQVNRSQAEKEVKDRVRRLEETNRALLTQMAEKMYREKAEQEVRRNTAQAFINPTQDKSLRSKTACRNCPRQF